MAGEDAMSQKPITNAIQHVGIAVKRVASAIQPVGSAIQPARETVGPPVEVRKTGMRINEIWLSRPDVVAYIEGIAPDKREVALVHAIEVGITEILVRRRRSLGH
jgi:hypothetical protein